MTYPVIAVKEKDPNIYYFESFKPLRQTTQALFDEGIYDNVKFIDSNGFVFVVSETKKVGFAGFWGYHPLLKGRQSKSL
jgi:hypothetical protein